MEYSVISFHEKTLTFAGHPKHAEVALRVVLEQFALVDRPHAELALHGADERRPLEQRPGQRLNRSQEFRLILNRVVKAHDHHILLTGALLRLHQTRRAVAADDEAAGDLGIKRAGVSGFLAAKDAANPRDDFVRGWVRRLVEIDDTIADELVELALERGAADGDRGVVRGADLQVREGESG